MPSELQSSPTHDAGITTQVSDFASGLWDGAIHRPIVGVEQLFDHNAGTAASSAQSQDNPTLGRQVGEVVGSIVPFLAARQIVRGGSSLLGLGEASGVMGTSLEAGGAGAIMGFGMTPVDNRNNFWESRSKNMAVSALTFATLTGSAGALGKSAMFAPEAGIGANIMRNAISGLPAGLVNSESQLLVDGKPMTLDRSVANNMLGYAAFGGVLGAFDSFNLHGKAEPQPAGEIQSRFPEYSPRQLEAGRSTVESELAQVRGSSENGKTMSVLDKLNDSSLNATQRQRVLDALSAVRENYTSYRAGDVLDPDQEKNWIHTQGELGRVLDSAKKMNLTPNQTEDALLGSMFSDSVKTKANFRVHHLDGATAADTYLSRMTDSDFTPDRIKGIVQAIKEHQIGPPGFMSMIYTGAIKGSLGPDALSHTADLQSLGAKIADPLNQTLVPSGEGGKAIQFTPEETALLQRAGVDKWYVPDKSTPWYLSSRALINGDSIDNYATPGGFSKIVGLNGPETDIFFRDKTLDGSLNSPRNSFKQAYKIMTPEGQQLADAELANTDAAINRAKGRVETWLRQERGIGPTDQMPQIPYWNSDLAYPDFGTNTDAWWQVHKIAPADRTADQQTFYDQHRYDGLNQQQIKEFQFAKQIRDRMVDELRREQRVDGSLPPDFKPAMSNVTNPTSWLPSFLTPQQQR